VENGEIVRFYVTNVANTRTFRVHFGDAKMKLVGSDVGRYEREEWAEDIIISPAERYIVEVLFDEPGVYVLRHESSKTSYDLGTVTVSNEDVDVSYADLFSELRTYDDVVSDIDAFREEFERPVDKTIRLSIELKGEMAGMDHSMMMEHEEEGGIEWEDTMPGMNARSNKENTQWKMIDEDSEQENMDIAWEAKVGDRVKVRLINDEESDHPMQHPIHFHGQRFLVLAIDDEPTENLVWKDTVLVPKGSTADLLFDMTNPGDWMFHCHIAEHLTNGMMGMLRVTEEEA